MVPFFLSKSRSLKSYVTFKLGSNQNFSPKIPGASVTAHVMALCDFKLQIRKISIVKIVGPHIHFSWKTAEVGQIRPRKSKIRLFEPEFDTNPGDTVASSVIVFC